MLVNPHVLKAGQNNTSAPANLNLNLDIKLKPLWAILITVFLILFLGYFSLPVLSFRFMSLYLAVALVLLPLIFCNKFRKVVMYIYKLIALIIIIMMLSSLPIFKAKEYRGLLGEVKSTHFTELISPVDMNQIPVVDRAFASMLAEKKLGDDFALGSRVTLGWPTRQMVNGELLWVIPLLHSGFFKWATNTDGTPAYLVVSATNPQDVRFVREADGKSVKIKYQPNAWYNQDLHRHLYLHGFVTQGLTDYTFELDDRGTPYWTVTVFNKNIGLRGNNATGIALVNVSSGEINFYQTKDVPAWVDRIQPADYVIEQLNWWGEYVRGFWNSKLGKRDLLMTTDGYNIIYGTDDRCYYYTGMSSVGSDEGAVGFVLVDTRTKQTHLYKLSGATEYAAMQSAEGKVQNFKYQATFPILINISGLPTYFITLKDAAGLVKMYAMVSVKDYSVVGVGETVKSARDTYLMTISASRTGNLAGAVATRVTRTGSVSRIGNDIRDGRTYYYLLLSAAPQKVFVANSDLSSTLTLTKPGDEVQLEFVDSTEGEINLSGFKNLSLK
jgi:hypothetical protein